MQCPFEILCGQGVPDGGGHEPLPLIPRAGPVMQLAHGPGLGLLQPLAQQAGKEMVVAVPAAFIVKGDDKEIGAVQMLQHLLAGDRGAKLPRFPAQHGVT